MPKRDDLADLGEPRCPARGKMMDLAATDTGYVYASCDTCNTASM